ncbi:MULTISPECIES: aspartate 1-decarboxylase [Helicobacter]|uniref:Aspartate 1-decarboxylase n=1 Tax=Helicobacter colisuis TaxID=2949739 RepID=A0ABT0TTH6_9HELI|nr:MULTISPECIES: aspartate 1-decarboxylase [Helicobacter]MCI2236476.1 aspartate 1-decarboxylase [Helicobacter sp. CaF467b]MCI7765336.1 aspartate 1-decarboxylase [Helicobacter sp.]MCL9819236.1 aspartate 1-decarboxylase [Helicobacter colisuis]MCL9821725.1 aspartate 1-decarboxylase [Helicobacter colisuis]MCL9822638.1 aspartate 1-decarboxylase [Helicobacter colisuis]
MNFTMLYSKIHRARVSDANLNYVGSITIDTKLMESAGLLEGQKVDIVNINNGERFSTYVIEGKSGDICLNGAAARKVQIGDKIIIMAYAQFSKEELENYEPKVVLVDENNQIIQIKKELKNV